MTVITDKLEVDGALILSPSLSPSCKFIDGQWIYVFLISSLNIPTRLLCRMQANSSGAKFLITIFKMKVKNDQRSKFSNWSNWKEEACFSGFFFPQFKMNYFIYTSHQLYSSSERGRKFRCHLFTFSLKLDMRLFYVVVVQWRQGNTQKKCAELLQ